MLKQALAVAGLAVAAVIAAAPAIPQDDAKRQACAAAPTHVCVLDLLWDQMPKVGRDYEAETKRAFIDAAMLTGDKALIDLYLARTNWRNPDALDSSYIYAARKKADRATLIAYGDKALSGLRFDWYQLSAIASGLAEVGEIARARKVAQLISNGADAGVTELNLRQHTNEVITYHDSPVLTSRKWADNLANDGAWWEEEQVEWLAAAARRAGNLSAFPQELQQRYKDNGWQYLRALARLAPQMTASGADAVPFFRGPVETWADPRTDAIAELVLAIAIRSHPDVRAAMLAAFDARQPAPPIRIARIRAIANDPEAVLGRSDKGLLGFAGGSYEQVLASRALASLSGDDFIAQARAGTEDFSMSRPAVLRAALAIAPTEEFAVRIADVMVELGEPRTIDGYDYAQYATEWAMETCKADLFKRAEARLARRDDLDTMMWRARFSGDPVAIIRYVIADDRITSEISSALSGYEPIILNGYCPAG